MATVFISHCSHDAEFARSLAERLVELGHVPWLDHLDIQVGDCLITQMQVGLEKSDFMALVMSPEAMASTWVDREWKVMFWQQNNHRLQQILPILLRSCNIPLFLRGICYADFTSDFERGLSTLAKALGGQVATKIESHEDRETDLEPLIEVTGPAMDILVESLIKGKTFKFRVANNLIVAQLKKQIMVGLEYSDRFEDGRQANTYLRSKDRNYKILDDNLTVEGNGILDGETLQIYFPGFAAA